MKLIIYIYIYIYIYISCLYQNFVRTAKPIDSDLFFATHMIPGKVFARSKFRFFKINGKKSKKSSKFFLLLFDNLKYKLPQIEQPLKVKI